MAGSERRYTAAPIPENAKSSGYSSIEKPSNNLIWMPPHSVFSKDVLARQVKMYKLAGIDCDPRLVFISEENQADYRLRRDVLIDAMIRLQLPPETYDDRGYPLRTYVNIDLNDIPLRIADVPPSPRKEPGIYEHRFIVFKNNQYDEDTFDGYMNTIIDMANTNLVMSNKQPFPKR